MAARGDSGGERGRGKWCKAGERGARGVLSHAWLSPGDSEEGPGGQVVATVAMAMTCAGRAKEDACGAGGLAGQGNMGFAPERHIVHFQFPHFCSAHIVTNIYCVSI